MRQHSLSLYLSVSVRLCLRRCICPLYLPVRELRNPAVSCVSSCGLCACARGPFGRIAAHRGQSSPPQTYCSRPAHRTQVAHRTPSRLTAWTRVPVPTIHGSQWPHWFPTAKPAQSRRPSCHIAVDASVQRSMHALGPSRVLAGEHACWAGLPCRTLACCTSISASSARCTSTLGALPHACHKLIVETRVNYCILLKHV